MQGHFEPVHVGLDGSLAREAIGVEVNTKVWRGQFQRALDERGTWKVADVL